MTAPDLSKIQYAGFTAYSDAILFDPYGHNIVFLSMFGNKSHIKAISGAIFSKAELLITAPSTSNAQHYGMAADLTFNSMIIRADAARQLDHVIFYPTAASYGYIDQSTRDIIFLFRPESDPADRARSLYLYLDKALSLPIHQAWTQDLIAAMTEEGLITDLPGYGDIQGQKITLWAEKITALITEGIQSRRFKEA